MLKINDLINEYLNFFKKGISYRELEKGYEITTPFLDDKNDYIQIYVDEVVGDKIILSDGGEILGNLEDRGVKLTNQRKNMIENIVRGYGVSISSDKCMFIETTISKFPQKKHALVQSMLKVDDMCYTAQSRTISIFSEEVATYFNKNDIFYSENMSVVGRTGFVHNYDFHIQRTRTRNERFVKLINNPSQTQISAAIFGWGETKEQRQQPAELFAFLNDDKKISSSLTEGLVEYGIEPVLKSRLNDDRELINKLAG